jgi:hypothetical protein
VAICPDEPYMYFIILILLIKGIALPLNGFISHLPMHPVICLSGSNAPYFNYFTLSLNARQFYSSNTCHGERLAENAFAIQHLIVTSFCSLIHLHTIAKMDALIIAF